MKKLRPYVIFDIARPNYIAAIFMRQFKKYPIIYIQADISSHLHATTKEALEAGKKMYEIKAERYCFENADGIFIKTAPDSLKHLSKPNMLGPPLKLSKNIICFNPYCSDEFIIPLNKNKLSKKDGELHLVYVGSMYNAPEDITFFTNFFKKLINQKMHVHLYVKTHHLSVKDDKKNIANLIEEFKDNKYFHLEFALPPKKLINEISKYDFGFTIDRFRDKRSKEHEFTTGNKIATYLEAGIPFLYTSTFKFINSLAKNYKIDFPIDTENQDKLDNLRERLERLGYKEMEKRIVNARNDFNLNKHIPRLEKFIKKVVEEKMQ